MERELIRETACPRPRPRPHTPNLLVSDAVSSFHSLLEKRMRLYGTKKSHTCPGRPRAPVFTLYRLYYFRADREPSQRLLSPQHEVSPCLLVSG